MGNKLKKAESHKLSNEHIKTRQTLFKNLYPGQNFIVIDKLAFAGAVIGLLCLFLGWFTLKPNRLSSGISMGLPASIGWTLTLLFFLLWCACFFLSFQHKKTWQPLILGFIANIILIPYIILLGSVASSLVQQNNAETRISPGAGFWITFLAIYLIIFSAQKGLKKKTVLKNILTWTAPAVFIVLLFSGYFNNLSVLVEYGAQRQRFVQELLQHIFLVTVCVISGTILGLILGIWATRNKKAGSVIFFLTNISQTIPSLALFGLLIAPLSALSFKFSFLREAGIRGIGNTPAIIALIIYSLLPIVRNTYASIQQIERSVIDSGRGMGLSRFGIFIKIEVPLSAPLVLEGIRIAAVQSIGLTAVAALIGAGGLGWFIFQGLGQAATDMVLLGAIPIIMLAIAADGFMRLIIRFATPKGLTIKEGVKD